MHVYTHTHALTHTATLMNSDGKYTILSLSALPPRATEFHGVFQNTNAKWKIEK